MALASAKQLLDELMGRDRNLAPTEKKNTCSWEDQDVCKHFLVKFCPNELFVNTKADLGPCSKIHDERLKKEYTEYYSYEQSNRYRKEGYEESFLQFCQSMLSDVEKRIRRARQRLSLGNKEVPGAGGMVNKQQPPPEPTDERVIVLNERIQELLRQVEQLGCEGKVEEAQGIMKLCDQLKEERRAIDKDSDTSHWLKQTAELAAAQEKQMEVCDICGAFLIVGDAQQRVDDHLTGKQHVGYAKLKEAVDEILARREKEREEKEKLREKEREERRKRRGVDEDEPVVVRRRVEEPVSVERDDKRRRRSRSPREDRRRRSRSRDRRDRERDHRRHGDRDRHRDRRHGSRDRSSSKVTNGGASPKR
uniref:Putative spliceosome subunit n=1 Tax=Ornithodoros turicata TaxID=34597 RepID=A0A2R5L9M8_9ACAR